MRHYFFAFGLLVSTLSAPPSSLAQNASFDPYTASNAQSNYLGSLTIYKQNTSAPQVSSDHTDPIEVISQQGVPNPQPSSGWTVSSSIPATPPYPSPANTSSSQSMPTSTQYATASSAFAPITDRILSDPTYLPLKGQLEGVSAYSYSNYEGNRQNSSGSKTLSFDTRGNRGTQNLIYGVTDNFSINFAMDYLSSITKDNYVSGRTYRSDSSGFTDPTFGATYRAIDQKDYPIDLDLRVYYTPNAISAKTASTDNGGSIAQGRQSGELSAQLSREMRALTIQGTAGAHFLGDRKSLYLGDGSTIESQSYMDYFVGAESQIRLTDKFSFNPGINDTFFDRTHVSNATEGLSYSIDPRNTLEPYLAINYQLIPNRLVPSIEYEHYFIGKEKDIAGSPANENGAWNNQDEDVIVARLRYVFF